MARISDKTLRRFLDPYDPNDWANSGSKAGRGSCSKACCGGPAKWQTEKYAYCGRHARRHVRNKLGGQSNTIALSWGETSTLHRFLKRIFEDSAAHTPAEIKNILRKLERHPPLSLDS